MCTCSLVYVYTYVYMHKGCEVMFSLVAQIQWDSYNLFPDLGYSITRFITSCCEDTSALVL